MPSSRELHSEAVSPRAKALINFCLLPTSDNKRALLNRVKLFLLCFHLGFGNATKRRFILYNWGFRNSRTNQSAFWLCCPVIYFLKTILIYILFSFKDISNLRNRDISIRIGFMNYRSHFRNLKSVEHYIYKLSVGI